MVDNISPGKTLGPYIIRDRLGEGTFGTLFLAERTATEEIVVLKVLTPHHNMEIGRDLFALGNRLLHLSHPNIVPTLDVRLEADPPYAVSAYVAGGTLASRLLPALVPLETKDALEIITQVGNALTYLHEQQVVHAGLQPTCVLFDLDNRAMLGGFDLAVGHPYPRRLARTAWYAAPEQETGACDERSDQFALATIAYHLLTGTEPDSQSPTDLTQAILQRRIPRHIGEAILRATQEWPEQRWPTVAAFLDAIRGT